MILPAVGMLGRRGAGPESTSSPRGKAQVGAG